MALPLSQVDFPNLQLTVDTPVLRMTWKCPVQPAEVARAYDYALMISAKQLLTKWLIDTRKRGCAFSSQYSWVLEQFYPRLVHNAEQHLCMAYVLMPSEYKELLEQNAGNHVIANNSYLHIRLFVEQEPALAWLLQAHDHLSMA